MSRDLASGAAERRKVAVLISGRGSNLQALIEAAEAADYPAEIVLVVSNVPEVQGLKRAEAAGIPTRVLPHRDYARREDFEAALSDVLRRAGAEIVCLAGFMRVLTAGFVGAWRDRVINIHPSLLPAFPGLDTHRRALEAGVKLHGCTVHLLREAVDRGPIIGQAAVALRPGDDEDSLAARVLDAEHRLYPRCLALLAAGRVRIEDDRAVIPDADAAGRPLYNPAAG